MSDYLALIMFPALIGLIVLGFPIAFSMIVVATLFGIAQFGDAAAYQLLTKIEDTASNSILAAVPLFIFMGACRGGSAWGPSSWGPSSRPPVAWWAPPRP